MIRICSCGQKNRIPAARLGETAHCGQCKAALPPLAEPIDADAETFDEVVRDARVPVLVDFWAAWCGPCRSAAPEVKKAASALAGRAVVLKVDTDAHPELGARYGVQGIPNFVVLKDGKVVRQQAGVVPAAQLISYVEGATPGASAAR